MFLQTHCHGVKPLCTLGDCCRCIITVLNHKTLRCNITKIIDSLALVKDRCHSRTLFISLSLSLPFHLNWGMTVHLNVE